jgi:hypothetical protein
MSSPASQTRKRAIGIDFGTTNSSIAYADRSGEVQLAKFPYLGSLTDSYRSLLYLQQTKVGGANTLKSWTGPEGIERYLSADVKGRLIQSLKSFLSSRNLHSTEVFGRRYTIEDLIARILRDLQGPARKGRTSVRDQDQVGSSRKAGSFCGRRERRRHAGELHSIGSRSRQRCARRTGEEPKESGCAADGERLKSGEIVGVRYGHEDTGGWSGCLHV